MRSQVTRAGAKGLHQAEGCCPSNGPLTPHTYATCPWDPRGISGCLRSQDELRIQRGQKGRRNKRLGSFLHHQAWSPAWSLAPPCRCAYTPTYTCVHLWNNTGLAWELRLKGNWSPWMPPDGQALSPARMGSWSRIPIPSPLIKYTCWARPGGVYTPSIPISVQTAANQPALTLRSMELCPAYTRTCCVHIHEHIHIDEHAKNLPLV